MSEEEKDRSENATDPIEKAADNIMKNPSFWEVIDMARYAVDKGLRDEYLAAARREISEAIREAVEAETAKLKAERDEWHSVALEYARSSDAAHEKLHKMENGQKFTG